MLRRTVVWGWLVGTLVGSVSLSFVCDLVLVCTVEVTWEIRPCVRALSIVWRYLRWMRFFLLLFRGDGGVEGGSGVPGMV